MWFFRFYFNSLIWHLRHQQDYTYYIIKNKHVWIRFINGINTSISLMSFETVNIFSLCLFSTLFMQSVKYLYNGSVGCFVNKNILFHALNKKQQCVRITSSCCSYNQTEARGFFLLLTQIINIIWRVNTKRIKLNYTIWWKIEK